ncbi:MAG: glycosyltransferase family 4 protein [Chloroflexi bacterium]|nr:glycosyltransferase family 4 protein [Chloroflexota bacterium]MCL5075341.1 glycosyltransferase family 4 protein [Chloroflexota bacterium]
MRVGIDARLVRYRPGGISTYILGLLKGLANIATTIEPIVLQSARDRRPLFPAAAFKRSFLWTPCHHRLEQFLLPLELIPLGLDILHSPDFIPPFRRRCKSVITVHDLAFLHYPQLLTAESKRYYGQIRQAVESAEGIIAVSESTKRDLREQLGVPETKITVIYEAADAIFRSIVDAEQVCSELWSRFRLKDAFFLFVGTLEPRKNLPTLLRAYELLRRQQGAGTSLRQLPSLVIAGARGWLYEEIFALVQTLQLEKSVIFVGAVTADDLLYLYNGALALIMPSLYEGFGLPALEAMSCGTAVIVSNCSSLPEVVGEAAVQVDPNDFEQLALVMQRLLVDNALRADLQRKGLERAKQFSWEQTARQTLEVYRRVSAA